MGNQARLVPALWLLAVACGDSGERAFVPAQPKVVPQVAAGQLEDEAQPEIGVPMDPDMEVQRTDDPGRTPQGGPELPPEFDLETLLREAGRQAAPDVSGPELPILPSEPSGYLVGVIRMPGRTVFLKLTGTTSQLAICGLAMRRACQSFELVEDEVQWSVPPGMQATFGVPGAMVPAALSMASDPDVRGNLTLLSGDGGGLTACVLGWLRNLDRPTPSDDALHTFLGRQERFLSSGGLDVVIIDLAAAIE